MKQLVGVFARPASAQYGPHAMITVAPTPGGGMAHPCEVAGGELTLSHEGLDLRYWTFDAVAGDARAGRRPVRRRILTKPFQISLTFHYKGYIHI